MTLLQDIVASVIDLYIYKLFNKIKPVRSPNHSPIKINTYRKIECVSVTTNNFTFNLIKILQKSP